MPCILLAILSRLSRFPFPAVGTDSPFCVDVLLNKQLINQSIEWFQKACKVLFIVVWFLTARWLIEVYFYKWIFGILRSVSIVRLLFSYAETNEKFTSCQRCVKCLGRISDNNSSTQADVLRQLVEGCLSAVGHLVVSCNSLSWWLTWRYYQWLTLSSSVNFLFSIRSPHTAQHAHLSIMLSLCLNDGVLVRRQQC